MAFNLPTSVSDIMGNPDYGYDQLPSYLSQALLENDKGYQNTSGMPSSAYVPMQQWANAPLASVMAQGQQGDPQGASAQDPSQAQAPTDPSQVGGGYGALSPEMQALFQRQAQDPNRALNNALIQGGAAMLKAKDLKTGLGDGVAAFGDTYNQTVNDQFGLNTPKVVPLADGAFTMVQLPGQQPRVLPNGQVAGFLQGQKILQGQVELRKAMLVQGMRQDGQDRQQIRAQGYEANTNLTSSQAALTNMHDALKVVAGDDDSGARQFAGKFPVAAGAVGSDFAAKNAILAQVKVDKTLAQGALQKGAITKSESELYGSDIPAITASNAVWREWLQRNIPIMEKINNKNQELVNAGATAGAPGLVARATNQGGSSAGGVQTITSKADFDALPSGTNFRAPDGSLRTKP